MPRDFLSDESSSPITEKVKGRDFLAEIEPQQESLGRSAALAIPRLATDVGKGLYHTAQNIPDYFEAAKGGIPAAFNTAMQNPMGALKQAGAGLAEFGNNAFNFPHDVANYTTNRLNLIPQDVNQAIQMGRMPSDTESMINQTFGSPQNQGEEAIRFGGRNIINAMGIGGVANKLNPLNLSTKSTSNSIMNKLSQGASGLQENANSLAKDIQNLRQHHIEEYQKIKNPIIDQYGKKEMYPTEKSVEPYPYISNTGIREKKNIPSFDMEHTSSTTKELNNQFRDKPLFETADKLQSSINKDIGNIMKEPPSTDKRDRLIKLNKTHESVKNEMDKFLRNQDPESADKLKEASDYYLKNVIPFRNTKKLQKISENDTKMNLKGIHNIFDTPNANIAKIASELPQESKNKILFSAIGGHNSDINTVVNKLKSKEGGGFSNLIDPSLKNDINTLNRKQLTAKIAKWTLGAALAAGTGIGGYKLLSH